MIDHLSGLFRTCDIICGNLVTDHLAVFFRESAVHICIDHAEGNGIYLDITWSYLFGQSFGK